MSRPHCRPRATLGAWLLLLALGCGACGADATSGSASSQRAPASKGHQTPRTLKISAIPDRDPSKLSLINEAMARYLATSLGVHVQFVPVGDYAASISLFKTGDLDLVFFGGLTGVQARLQTPGAMPLAQRDIDDAFRSVFIANTSAQVAPIGDVKGLIALKGKRFTFGSESSTSGRLMPEYFLDQAGISSGRDFSGPPGFSGSHDKTVDLVQAGTYQAGALSVEVWRARVAAGTVDLTKVAAVFTTPPYHDYHWIAGPQTDSRFGGGFTARLKGALLALDYTDPAQAKLLDLYGAKKFVATDATNYAEIESIGRKLRLIS